MREVEAVLTQHAEQERRRDLRAGLVAATVVNVNRRKGARVVQAQDWFRPARKASDYLTPAEAVAVMEKWAKSHNKHVARKFGAGGDV